ncbi:MAG: hypothetical protein LBB29_03680 [Holosporaceae bacterium]|jgi:hypothetical protein|nr:hypothetical protein [Holosporaceae bacterium]
METLWLCHGSFDLWREKKIVAALEKAPEKIVQDASARFQFHITVENFPFIEQVVPLIRKNKIDVEQIVLENGNSLKIKTILSTSLLQKILRSSNKQMSITADGNSRSEYDRIDSNDSSDKKNGAVICIKMK